MIETQKIIDQMNNNICRIFIKDKIGTGFFVNIPYKSKLLPVLITSIINKDDILNNNSISIYINNDKNRKIIKLDNNRKIYSSKKYDITIIEIKEKEDNLNNKYLELDDEIINYFKIKKDEILYYFDSVYSNESIYLLNYAKDNDIFVSYGKLSYLNNKKLYYQCNIKEDSSGAPILLANNQKLIGIHNIVSKKFNKGSLLIYSIKEFSTMKDNLLLINKEKKHLINNYIIGELDIKEDNQKIRIINSYEQLSREGKIFKYEKEIKDNCEIRINDKLIPFSYFHKFSKKGKYKIKYTFLLSIIKTNYMFYECSSLANIDLSNFNTKNISNMSHMFYECSSLTNINLSNFDTTKVKDMSYMFYECKKLKNLDLSSFNNNKTYNMSYMFYECSSLTSINLFYLNTYNVKDMSYMFCGCSSLKNIDLSNFNTNNVTNMSNMFSWCSSLKNIDLYNFNTNNVINMSNIFGECSSLISINLSNFNTNKVSNMSSMFNGCLSLINLDLSNFNTNNVTDMSCMFYECSSLTNINLSKFNTNNATNMNSMFTGCKKLNKNNIIVGDKNILKKNYI